MTTAVENLAIRFETANQAVIDTVAGMDEAQLGRHCSTEQCTAAALACHIAEANGLIAGWVQAVAAGESLPQITMADVDRINADRAAANTVCAKPEALAQLRESGAATAAVIRGLRDEDLERTTPFSLFGGADFSARTLIERILIGNATGHLPSLQAAAKTTEG